MRQRDEQTVKYVPETSFERHLTDAVGMLWGDGDPIWKRLEQIRRRPMISSKSAKTVSILPISYFD